MLADPEGYDTVEIRRLLADRGLRVLRIEELPESEMELQTQKPSEKGVAMQNRSRQAG